MPYCPKCGVQVEPDRKNCPLCTFPIPETEEDVKKPDVHREGYLLNRYRFKQAENRRRWKEARFFVYIATAISLIILSFIFGVQDYYFSSGLTWSRYVIISNFAAIVGLFFLLGFIPSFFPNFLGLCITAGGFLYLLDSINRSIDWFWDLGLVICVNTLIWSLILRQIIQHSRRRGLNIPAYSLIAAALGCLSIEIIRNLYRNRPFQLTWSLPVISTIIPLSGLLLFIHFLLSPRIQEKLIRRFHL